MMEFDYGMEIAESRFDNIWVSDIWGHPERVFIETKSNCFISVHPE